MEGYIFRGCRRNTDGFRFQAKQAETSWPGFGSELMADERRAKSPERAANRSGVLHDVIARRAKN